MRASPATERTLVPPAALLLLALGVAGVLTLLVVHPRTDAQERPLDVVDLAYLRAALAHRPDDPAARLALVEALVHVGDLDQALALLAPLLEVEGETGAHARERDWQLRLQRWRQTPAADARHLALRQELVEALRRRLAPLGLEERRQWQALALELGGLALASELLGPSLAVRAAFPGDPLAAADALLAAAHRAEGPEVADRLLLDAIELLRGVQDTAPVLERLEQTVARFSRRAAVLDRAVSVALERSALGPARRWQALRVALTPGDVEVLRRQMELALAAGEPSEALGPARRLARLLGTAGAHREAATVAGWAGALDVSLQEWMWLARHERSAEPLSRAMALSRMLWDLQAQVELLLLRAEGTGLGPQERRELVALQEALGRPEAGERYLTAWLQQHPDDTEALALAAEVRTRVKDLEGALAAWEAHQRHAGPSVTVALHQAELHWRRERPRAALDALLAVRHLAAPHAVQYWTMLGQVALALDEGPVALDAWRAVHALEPWNTEAARHVAGLLRRTGQHARALVFAREALRTVFEPTVLLHGLEAGVATGRWEEALALVRQVAPHTAQLEADARLGQLVAQVLRHTGQPQRARQWLQRALAAAPRSSHVRLDLLALLLEQQDTQAARARLVEWEAEAVEAPEYWAPFAYAWLQLGQPAQAAPWLERLVRTRPDDPFLRLEQAEVLVRAGQLQRARAVWEEVRTMLAPHVQRIAAAPPPLAAGDVRLLLAWLDVLERLGGEAASEAWVPLVEERLREDVGAQRWLLGHYLRRSDARAARGVAERLARAGQRLEPWQRLALAALEDDSQALQRLLEEQDAGLTLEDQVYAHRLLGQDATAWALVAGRDASSEGLRQQRLELRERVAPLVEVRGSFLTQRELGALGLSVRGRTGQLLDSLFEVQAGLLQQSPRGVPAGAPAQVHDVEAGLRATFGHSLRRTQLAAGVDVRGAALLPRASAAQHLQVGPQLSGRAELGLNAAPEAGNPLRLSTVRHHLTLSGSLLLGRRSDVSLSLTGAQYRTRSAALLGHGAEAAAAVGRTFPLGPLQLRGYLTQEAALHWLLPGGAGWEQAHAAPYLLPWTLSSGAGLSLEQGDVGEATGAGHPVRLLADAWAGWLWPFNRPGYRVSLGVGLPLPTDTQVGLETEVANTMVPGTTDTSFNLGLSLHQRFGP